MATSYNLPEITYGYLPDGSMLCTATNVTTGVQCGRRTRQEVNGNPMCGPHIRMIGSGLPIPRWADQ